MRGRAPYNVAFSRERERERVMTMTRREKSGERDARCWWLAVDPSRRPDETRRYAWDSMTRKWVFPHPIIQRARVFYTLARGPRSDPVPFASSRVMSSRMKMSALTHREPTWKDTNASVRARGYNKSSACMCKRSRGCGAREDA